MNKYFITFGAVALSFGAVYGAEADLGEPKESAAIGGTSVPVEGGDLLAPSVDTQEPSNYGRQLTPYVGSVILPGDSGAKDSDSTNGNSGTPAVGELDLQSVAVTPAVASPAITAQNGTEEGVEIGMTTPALAETSATAAADEDEGMGGPTDTAVDATTAELTVREKSVKSDENTTVENAAKALEEALADVAVTITPKTGEAAPASTLSGVSPIIPSQMREETKEPKPAVLDAQEGMVREDTAAGDADSTASPKVCADID